MLPYKPPTIHTLTPHEVIRKLLAELQMPIGESSEERRRTAVRLIREILARLPESEHADVIWDVVGASGRWVLKADWFP